MEIGKDLGGAGRPLSEGSPYPPNLPDPPRTSPMTPPFWKRRFVSLFVSGGVMGEVFVFWKVVFCKVRLSRLFCGWEAIRRYALHECPQIGCEAAPCKEFAPPARTKNFPREHPPYTKRIQSSLCMGGCSWGKFGVGQGGLEGRETPPKGVSLRLQGLSHLTPRKLQPTSGTRRGRNGGQDQDRVTLREPSHRSPICRRGDTCCCGEASSAPERRT